MPSKKRPALPADKPRTNTPLLFLLLVLFPLFGGYYTFSVLLCGAALVLLLAFEVHRGGGLTVPTGVEAWCLYGLCAAFPFIAAKRL